jgi:hypothetical protein
MRKIEVDGVKYKVVETLAYQQAGCKAVVVEDLTSPTKENVAVLQGGRWRFWTAKDRLQPPVFVRSTNG